jgi:hypothetical protein
MAVSQSLTLTQVSQSVEGNSTQVRVLWTSTQTGESYNLYTRTAKYFVSVNGGAEVVHSVSYTLPKGKTTTILDTIITVPHNADGTGSVTVRTWMDTDISAGVIQKTSTLTLTKIPRATTPTFSASAADMGSKVTITMNRAVSSFVHDLYYSFAGAAFVYIAGDLGTSYSWTVPDVATSIPNATSGTMTVRCVTRSGSTTIGTKDVVFTVKVPGSVMPTISGVTLTEATEGLAAQFGAFVKDKTTLVVAVTAAGAKGSTIESCTSTLEGASYTGLRFTSGVLTTAGTLDLVTTVTDSRRRSVKLTTKVIVTDYYLPEVPKLVAYRVDANGVAKSDGKYLCVDYAYKVAPVGNKNTSKMTMSAKRSIDTTWSDILTGSSYNNAAVRKFDKEYTTDYQFDIKIEVVDWFGAKAEYIATLPTAKVIMDLKANGLGVAFGKTSEFDGFEVDMPANGESFKLIGVRSYEFGDAYGHILYNNGLLMQWGMVSVTPTAVNTVTSLRVVFPIAYAYRPHITGTLLSNTPTDVDWAMGVGGSETEARTGLVAYVTRGSMYAAPIRWMAVGLADTTKLPEVTTE